MRRKTSMNIVLVALIISISVISIVYAALQSNLKINGTATVNGKWDIYFENLSEPSILGTASVIDVNLSNTLFQLNLELIKPLDSVTYEFDVRNGGNIDAKIAQIVKPDVDAFTASQLTYKFTYIDGTELKEGDLLPSCKSAQDLTCVKKLKLTVSFNDVDSLNSNNSLSLSLDTSILYVQA